KIKPLWLEEKEIIERAISLCNGNINLAAVYLEISPSTIYRKKQGWKNKDAA
ncbi:MAG TPA: sigma-54-dependent Fis family transcriptional regulator, partial [Rhizobiales bacterium]|nr:sigma-54-dependent Fis family transcriptional regulator [Hyphomicrobiales bacterium]